MCFFNGNIYVPLSFYAFNNFYYVLNFFDPFKIFVGVSRRLARWYTPVVSILAARPKSLSPVR